MTIWLLKCIFLWILVNVGQSTVGRSLIIRSPFESDTNRTFRGDVSLGRCPKRSGNSPNPWKFLWVKSRLVQKRCDRGDLVAMLGERSVVEFITNVACWKIPYEGVMVQLSSIIYKWWIIGTSSILFLDFPKLKTCENHWAPHLVQGLSSLLCVDFPPMTAISSCLGWPL